MVQVAHVLSNREKDNTIERFIPMERFEWYAWECKRRMVQDEHSHLAGKPFFPVNQLRAAAKYMISWGGVRDCVKTAGVFWGTSSYGGHSQVLVEFK